MCKIIQLRVSGKIQFYVLRNCIVAAADAQDKLLLKMIF